MYLIVNFQFIAQMLLVQMLLTQISDFLKLGFVYSFITLITMISIMKWIPKNRIWLFMQSKIKSERARSSHAMEFLGAMTYIFKNKKEEEETTGDHVTMKNESRKD